MGQLKQQSARVNSLSAQVVLPSHAQHCHPQLPFDVDVCRSMAAICAAALFAARLTELWV
eukprot:1452743-Rhodomonas_salina.1